MRIKVASSLGGIGGFLESLRPGDGGMPQGLLTSIYMYALLPQDLDVRVTYSLPPPCCSVHPVVLEAFRLHYKGDLGVAGPSWPDGVRV